jgi:pyruvate dehydrogenase complex dehydrogenase (E1) component
MAKSPSPVAAEPMSDKERQLKYQTEDDLRSLTRAQEVLDDPERAKRARALAEEQESEISKVIDQLSSKGLISSKQAMKAKKKAEE